jgi:hypothetical protein
MLQERRARCAAFSFVLVQLIVRNNMNKLDRAACRFAAGLFVGMAVLPAHADGTGETILNVSNLRLLHPDGSQFLAGDVAGLSTSNIAGIPGTTAYYPLGDQDLGPSCSLRFGVSCNPIYPNYFQPYRDDAYHFANYYTYVNADQRQQGALFPDKAGSLTINTRGDIGYSGGTASAAFNGFATQMMDAHFKPTGAGAIVFSFDAQPYALTRQDFTRGGPLTASVAFSLTLRDLTTDETAFVFAPDALNFTVSSNDGHLRRADPGLMHFTGTTGVLDPNDEYELRLEQRAASVANLIAVPEPSAAAMLLAGLGMFAALRARSRA